MRLNLTLLKLILCLNLLGQEIDFSITSGVFDEEFQLELYSTTAGEIRYTLDGSQPTANSLIYNNPILVKERNSDPNTISNIPTNPPNTSEQYVWKAPLATIPKARIIKAAIFNNGIQISQIVYEEYFIGRPLTEIQMPIFSIQIDSSELFDYEKGIYVAGKDYDASPNTWQPGNYYERGEEWERVMSLSYYESGKLILRQNTQIQIHGGGSRNMPCKSLRFSAKNSLGNGLLEHAFFADKPWLNYKRLLLRNAGQDWYGALFTDVLLQSLIKDQGIEHQASKQVVLFINGSYWGIHNLRERYDKYYFSNYHDNDIEDIDYLEIASEFITKEGNTLDYELMNESLLYMDLSVLADYEKIADQIDISNFIEHHISKVYGGGIDWSGNNERIWRPKGEQNKWRWIANDYDDAFKDVHYDSYLHATNLELIRWPNPEWSTRLFRSLMSNENFAIRYKNRLKYLLESTYSAENITFTIDSIAGIYRSEMTRQIERWNYPSSINGWEDTIEEYKTFAKQRPEIIWSYFNLLFPNIYENPMELKIAPNPTTNYFFIDLPESFEESSSFKIFGLDGKEYYEGVLSSSQRNEVAIPNLNNGVYIIQVLNGGEKYMSKLIVY